MFGLCAWNLWGAFSNGKVFVRTTEYRVEKSKTWFWIGVVASVPITIITGGLALLMTAGLLGFV
jgi:hypothetical protein